MPAFRLSCEEDYFRRFTTGGAIHMLTDLATTTTCPGQKMLRARTGCPSPMSGRELYRSCKQWESVHVSPFSYQRVRARHEREPWPRLRLPGHGLEPLDNVRR